MESAKVPSSQFLQLLYVKPKLFYALHADVKYRGSIEKKGQKCYTNEMVFRSPLRSVGVGTVLWLLPAVACAQPISGDIPTMISGFVTWAIAALNLGIWIIFSMLTQLLDTSLFLDANMTLLLNEVWQLSRNLVNIAFAVVLIGAAVYTVVTAKKEFIKDHLGKFVLAVVLVNFSWFIPRVLIDVGNIAAATVFDIPSLLTTTNTVACEYRSPSQVNLASGRTCNLIPPNNPGDPPQYMCPCAALIDAQYFLSDPQAAALNSTDGWNEILGNVMYVQLTDFDSLQNAAPSSVVLNGLIINHARLMGLASVPPSVQSTEIKALIMFLLQEAIVLLLHVALFFPLAAMVLAFAIRIPVLWLTIAFMPFMVLQYVIPEQFIGEYPKKLMSNFISAVFLPAKVGIPLTIGFIMVNAGMKANILQPLQGVRFNLTNSISDYWELLWLVMVLGIIWEGVFETLKNAGVMGKFSENIKSTGESLGRLAIKAPLHLPILPGGSPLSMMRQFNPRRIESAIDNSDNLEDALKNLRGGNSNIKKAAQQHAGDNQKLKELDTDIKDLTTAINAGNAAEEKRLRDKISGTYDGVTNNADIGTLIQEMKNSGNVKDNGLLVNLEMSKAALDKAKKP